jgi:hypothetical protein
MTDDEESEAEKNRRITWENARIALQAFAKRGEAARLKPRHPERVKPDAPEPVSNQELDAKNVATAVRAFVAGGESAKLTPKKRTHVENATRPPTAQEILDMVPKPKPVELRADKPKVSVELASRCSMTGNAPGCCEKCIRQTCNIRRRPFYSNLVGDC